MLASHQESSAEALATLKRTHRTEVSHRREHSLDILTRADEANKAALEKMRTENAKRVAQEAKLARKARAISQPSEKSHGVHRTTGNQSTEKGLKRGTKMF